MKIDVASPEIECVIYCKVTNADGLHKADRVEKHVQLEATTSEGLRTRVRKTVFGPSIKYVHTLKAKPKVDIKGAVQILNEKNVEVDKEYFEIFASGAKKGLVKNRHSFNSNSVTVNYKDHEGKDQTVTLSGIIYEVDVYIDRNGDPVNWVKIDVELNSIFDQLKEHQIDYDTVKFNIKISHLPFAPVNPIMSTTDNEEEKQFLGNLWDQHFNRDPLEVIHDGTEKD